MPHFAGSPFAPAVNRDRFARPEFHRAYEIVRRERSKGHGAEVDARHTRQFQQQLPIGSSPRSQKFQIFLPLLPRHFGSDFSCSANWFAFAHATVWQARSTSDRVASHFTLGQSAQGD
jgi:hypothetical protein